VAQRVQRHALLDPGRIGRLVKQAVELAGGHRLAGPTAGKQPAFLQGRSRIVTRWILAFTTTPPIATRSEWANSRQGKTGSGIRDTVSFSNRAQEVSTALVEQILWQARPTVNDKPVVWRAIEPFHFQRDQ
jgi:hypothetical protein